MQEHIDYYNETLALYDNVHNIKQEQKLADEHQRLEEEHQRLAEHQRLMEEEEQRLEEKYKELINKEEEKNSYLETVPEDEIVHSHNHSEDSFTHVKKSTTHEIPDIIIEETDSQIK